MNPDEPETRLTPERWREVEALFLATRDRVPGERATFLEQACGSDVALRHEVESLLAGDQGATGFLEPPGVPAPVVPDFQITLRDNLAGRYAIERELGRGGMATVYLAHDVKHDRPVALKVLHPELAATLGPERFLREIKLAARLDHPHILTVHDSGETAGGLWFTMPYVEGESLRNRLAREPQLPLADAVRITRAVADALGYAQRQGIIHRDVKPENILLQGERCVLADFGVARAVDAAGERLTETGFALGTPAYMSPEQGAADRHLDARSDIYSLGCVVYEMLAGEPPFTGRTAQALIARRLADPVPDLCTVRDVPRQVERVVRQALARSPADRFADAPAFARALEAAASAPRVTPSPAVRRGRLAGAAVLLVALAGAAVWLRARPAAEDARDAALLARKPHEFDASRGLVELGAEDQRSIAVLPFVNLSPAKEEDEYFADGMTDELINTLSKVQGLRVAARSSVFAFKGKSADPQDVSEKLHVTTVLAGSVRKAGNRLRVSVELVSARDGRRLWFDTYDRTLTDVFTVQEEVARAITGALQLRLTTMAGTPVLMRPTDDLEAYKLYLKGRYYSYTFDDDKRQLAVEYFRKAVERDPSYALAWAGLADGYTLVAIALSQEEISAVRESARAAALRAAALDSTLPEAHAALGNIQYYFDWNWGPAEQSLRRAIALNPNNALTHRWYSELLTIVGRYPEAVTEAERAERLDPLNPFMVLGTTWAYTSARQYGRAAEAARRWIALDSTSPWAYMFLGRSQLLEGKQKEAFANLGKAAHLSKDGVPQLVLAYAYAATGQREKARRILSGVRREPVRAWPPSNFFAGVYAALGDFTAAFAWLERGYAAHEDDIPLIAGTPWLDPLRGDPRFTSLLTRMRLPT